VIEFEPLFILAHWK